MYQEQSHLLDPHLETCVEPAVQKLREAIEAHQHEQSHVVFRYLYLLTKTRGYKTIGRFSIQ